MSEPLRPLVQQFERRLSAGTAGTDATPVMAGLCDQLTRRLLDIAARTLVRELGVATESGRLIGDTPQRRFADFAASVDLDELLRTYPVLSTTLRHQVETSAEAATELLRRWAADRPTVVAELLGGSDPGPLAEVRDAGDSHAGRAVALVRFAGGATVVHKPRPSALHQWFAELIDWLNELLPADVRLLVPRCVARDGYAWVEFVRYRPCDEQAQVERFYRRLGVLLAVLHVAGGTDFHLENLVAAGEQPVLVDLETLFHPTPADRGAIADPAAEALDRSVARTALLPYLWVGEHGAVDLSGVGGGHGDAPDDVPHWVDAGTDRMRLGRGRLALCGSANRPRLDGRDTDPVQYRRHLVAGFRLGYDLLAAHRARLREFLQRAADLPTRVVPASTRFYAGLLAESTEPDLLRDPVAWESAFDAVRLRSGPLVEHELADLRRGDIPLFTGRPGSTELRSSQGVVVPGVLARPELASCLAVVAGMGPRRRAEQEWVIAAALATREPVRHEAPAAVAPRSTGTGPPDPARLLVCARRIADELVVTARHGHGRVNWLGLEPLDGRHWGLLPMGASLASGYPGVALFLAQLAAVDGDERYAELAARCLTPLPELIGRLGDDPELVDLVGPGALAGLGGIGYALARLAPLLGQDAAGNDLLTTVNRLLRVMTLADGDSPDLATGWAGGLVAMLAVHAATGLPESRRLADRYGRLLGTADLTGLGDGVATGRAGIGWALRRHGALSPDGPPDVVPARTGGGWCRGPAGLALTGASVPTTALLNRVPVADHSLCHGELGVIEALAHIGDPAVHHHAAQRVLADLEHHGPRCAPGTATTPGLLHGLAGIGYGLLRLGFPDRVPSLLSMDIEHSSARTTGP